MTATSLVIGEIKRDALGRVIPSCDDGHPITEMGLLLPSDLKWDVWKCGICNVVWPVYMLRGQIEAEAKVRENPDRRLTERERIAQLEAEVARLRQAVDSGVPK